MKISFHATFLVLLLLGTLGSVFLATSWNDFSALASPGQGTLFATVPFFAELLKINSNNGAFEVVGPTWIAEDDQLVPIPSLAIDPDTGILYGGGGGGFFNLYKIDKDTALLTLVGPTNQGSLVGLDFSLDGQLFAAVNPGGPGSGGGSLLATVDKNTGDTTIIGPFGVSHLGAIAFAPDGILYGATENDGQQVGELYTINTDTGQANLVAPILLDGFPTVGGFASLQFGCNGILFGGGGLFVDDFGTINPLSGTFNLIANEVAYTIGAMAFDSQCQDGVVGGEFLSIDTTALLLAGVQSPTGIMLTLIIVSSGIGVSFVLVQKRRKLKK